MTDRPSEARKRRASIDWRSECGFSLVEVLVAVLLLVTAALATMGLLTTGARTTYRAEARQVAINVAQRELEELRGEPFGELALTSLPGTSTDPDDPRSQVSGEQLTVAGEDPADLVYNGDTDEGGNTIEGGTVSPGPEAFTTGDVSGTIHRFVVWQDDVACGAGCAGAQDVKRALVAVTVNDTALSEQPFLQIGSEFMDGAEAANSTDGAGGSGQVVTGQQLYLSDTPCSTDSADPPAATPADHDTHDTTAGCGGTAKPDALLTSAPTDPAPADPADPALMDYATEVEPGGQPSSADRGVQLLRPGDAGCDYTPAGANPEQLIHRWVSRPMPSAFEIAGGATLELWTRTVNGVSVAGELCAYLFKRNVDGDGTITDTLLVDADNSPNAYFSHAANPWPQQWTGLRISMPTADDTVASGDRIGVAVTMERDGTSDDAIEFIYDHPDHASRLEVKTSTPLG